MNSPHTEPFVLPSGIDTIARTYLVGAVRFRSSFVGVVEAIKTPLLVSHPRAVVVANNPPFAVYQSKLSWEYSIATL